MSFSDVRLKEEERVALLYRYERSLWEKGYFLVAGVDEAGRGPLAGPVAAAAVVFSGEVFIEGLNDSKKLTSRRRELLAEEIKAKALAWNVVFVSEDYIDRCNILEASREAMRRAVRGLPVKPHHVLVDGPNIPALSFPQTALVKGDTLSASIAAASILAKVARDHYMEELHARYPYYGFDRHKGYPTSQHLQALQEKGPCPCHRRSFAPVKKLLPGR